MNRLNTDRLRGNLRTAVANVEQALQHMSEVTGEELGDLRTRAGRRLHDAHDRLDDMQHHTAVQLRRSGRHMQAYVHDHPWQVMGGLTIAVAALSVLARARL